MYFESESASDGEVAHLHIEREVLDVELTCGAQIELVVHCDNARRSNGDELVWCGHTLAPAHTVVRIEVGYPHALHIHVQHAHIAVHRRRPAETVVLPVLQYN